MMNKTIKIIATATAALMMIAGVSACGSDTGGDSDKGRVYYLNLKAGSLRQVEGVGRRISEGDRNQNHRADRGLRHV